MFNISRNFFKSANHLDYKKSYHINVHTWRLYCTTHSEWDGLPSSHIHLNMSIKLVYAVRSELHLDGKSQALIYLLIN